MARTRLPDRADGGPIKVCVLTPYEAWRDGQARKEAKSLAAAGADVTLIGYGRQSAVVDETDGYQTIVLAGPPVRWRAGEAISWPVRVAVNTALNIFDSLKSILPGRLVAGELVDQSMLSAAVAFAPDVVHAHNPHTMYTGWKVARRTGALLVVDLGEHFVEYFVHLGYPRFVQRASDWIERRVVPDADAVIATCPLTANSLRDRHGCADITLLLNSLPLPDEWSPMRPTSCHEPVRILSRGGVRPNLHYENLIGAMAHLRGSATLTIQGIVADPMYERQLHGLIARLGLDNVVTLTGRYDPLESTWFANDFDIGIGAHPIENDNLDFALSCRLYAYMNGGLALAMSDSAAHRQLPGFSGAGVLLDTSSAEAIAQTLAPLVSDPDRIMACKLASAALAPSYSWERQEEKLFALYRRLAGTQSA